MEPCNLLDNHKCLKCDSTFENKKLLNKHLKICDDVKCPYCIKTFKSVASLNRHIVRCTNIYNFKKLYDFDKNKIDDALTFYGSISEMSRILNINSGYIRNVYDELNIDTSVKRSSNSNNVKERRTNTNIEKYGCEHNFSKQHPSRKKWEQKLLDEEGITNVFQRESVKKKLVETMISRYGVSSAAKSPLFNCDKSFYINKYGEEDGLIKYAEHNYKRGICMRLPYFIEKYGETLGPSLFNDRITNFSKSGKNGMISSLSSKFLDLLNELNISDIEDEFCINQNSRNYFYDIKIKNIIFELNCTYWHSDPTKYKEDDILSLPAGKTVIAKDLWQKDVVKKNVAIEHGYTVYYIWEREFKNIDELKLKILKILENENQINQKN